jgi:hypothetical protein
MSITIECDEQCEVRSSPDNTLYLMSIIYKNTTINIYRKQRFEINMSVGICERQKHCFVEISGIYEDCNKNNVCFKFPYELRKLAFDMYTEIDNVMSCENPDKVVD